MNIVATIQARTGSSRLSGKVLLPILGRPMLARQVERLQQSRLIDQVVVATSTSAQDDPIARLADELGVGCFRGSEEDVVGRVVGALRSFDVDVHVEFTGDSPLPDPLLVDQCIGYYLRHADAYDYVSNAMTISYPPGVDVAVYPASVLADAEGRITDAALREHVGVHITQHPERYRLRNLEAPTWFRYPDYHLEVDTAEDYEVVSTIFEACYPGNPGFGLAAIIAFLQAHPELVERNRYVERRWMRFRRVASR